MTKINYLDARERLITRNMKRNILNINELKGREFRSHMVVANVTFGF